MQSEEYFKYLREFDYIFETNLGYESGATQILLMKKPKSKILLQVYL